MFKLKLLAFIILFNSFNYHFSLDSAKLVATISKGWESRLGCISMLILHRIYAAFYVYNACLYQYFRNFLRASVISLVH